MLVYFITSKKALNSRIENLRSLVKIIHGEGHVLTYDWLEPIYATQQKEKSGDIDWPQVYKSSIEAITRADVVVAETSVESFGVGYQVAMATHLKKPTLLLRADEVADHVFASGIPAGDVVQKSYDAKNVEGIMRKFFKDNDIQAKDMRFNFFIDRPIYNYLRWAAYKTGKTKAEILRDLVSKEIDKTTDINI